jgi:NADH-quinone oxidoreductase subunit E
MRKGWLSTDLIEAVANTSACADGGVRSGELLQHVRPGPGRQVQDHGLHQPAVRAVGAVHAADYLKQKLGIGFNETTPTAGSPSRKASAWAPAGRAGDAGEQRAHVQLHAPEQIDRLLGE